MKQGGKWHQERCQHLLVIPTKKKQLLTKHCQVMWDIWFLTPPKKKCRYLWHFVSRISVGPRASSLLTADPLDVGVRNPTQDASDHQDDMTFFRFRKSQPKPSLATIASWVGEHPKVYLKIRDTPKMMFNAPHSVVHLQVFAPPSE